MTTRPFLRDHITTQAPTPWAGMTEEQKDAAVAAASRQKDAAMAAAHAAYRQAVGSGYGVTREAAAKAKADLDRAETAAWSAYRDATFRAGRG